MYLNSVFSTTARFPPRTVPRPPAPISPRTTLLFADCARADLDCSNPDSAPPVTDRIIFRRLVTVVFMSIFSSPRTGRLKTECVRPDRILPDLDSEPRRIGNGDPVSLHT